MSEIVDHAKESGHWYRRDGSPAYTIIGKNGQERPTTLRDARKEKLVPSVTTIIHCAAAPGLMNWMIDQAIMSALTLPRIFDECRSESDDEYLSRIKADSKEQAKKAAERGIQIHAWVQGGFEGKLDCLEGLKYYESALHTLDYEGHPVNWICEKSFATKRYGGKVDLHNNADLIDIKTTDKDIATLKTWDEHSMQLVAYDNGIGHQNTYGCNRRCGILYINVNTAESRVIWIPEEELRKGWFCFNALLDFWYAKTGLGGE